MRVHETAWHSKCFVKNDFRKATVHVCSESPEEFFLLSLLKGVECLSTENCNKTCQNSLLSIDWFSLLIRRKKNKNNKISTQKHQGCCTICQRLSFTYSAYISFWKSIVLILMNCLCCHVPYVTDSLLPTFETARRRDIHVSFLQSQNFLSLSNEIETPRLRRKQNQASQTVPWHWNRTLQHTFWRNNQHPWMYYM